MNLTGVNRAYCCRPSDSAAGTAAPTPAASPCSSPSGPRPGTPGGRGARHLPDGGDELRHVWAKAGPVPAVNSVPARPEHRRTRASSSSAETEQHGLGACGHDCHLPPPPGMAGTAATQQSRSSFPPSPCLPSHSHPGAQLVGYRTGQTPSALRARDLSPKGYFDQAWSKTSLQPMVRVWSA